MLTVHGSFGHIVAEVCSEAMVGRAGLQFVIGAVLPDNQIQLRCLLQLPSIGILLEIMNANSVHSDDHIAPFQAGGLHEIVFLFD